MKLGDLVRFSKAHYTDDVGQLVVGVLVEIHPATGVPGGMASILWNHESSAHRNDWLYRVSKLEVVNETR